MRLRQAAVAEAPPQGRRTVATYRDYADAQKAVDKLSDLGFPVERTAIVADDISFVEQVTGQRNYASVAVQGMLTGAFVGAILGFLLGLFSLIDPLASAFVIAFWGLLLGGVAGIVIGLIGHALTFGRRDFSSVGGFQAGHFDVLADADVADEAERQLSKMHLLGVKSPTGA